MGGIKGYWSPSPLTSPSLQYTVLNMSSSSRLFTMNDKSQFRLGYFMRLIADGFKININSSGLDIISTHYKHCLLKAAQQFCKTLPGAFS